MGFSDTQRAAVFVRDRATCSFSGKSLWILDYGATPFWDYDWVDHIKPESRGGRSTLDNAACAASNRNWLKRNNTADSTYLFRAGLPTVDCYYLLGAIPSEIAAQLARFSTLEPSDWYFNRALSSVLLYLKQRVDGATGRSRGQRYWCAAAARKLAVWRQMTDRPGYQTLEERNLVPGKGSADVDLMLELRQAAADPRQVATVARQLLPHYVASCQVVWDFANAAEQAQRSGLLEAAKRNGLVAPLVLRVLTHNQSALANIQQCSPVYVGADQSSPRCS